MHKQIWYIILFFVSLSGAIISYMYSVSDIRDFGYIQNARLALQDQNQSEAQIYLQQAGKKGDYLRAYVAYYMGDLEQVEVYMVSDPGWQELYLLGNTHYYRGGQVSHWEEKQVLWGQALKYYEQAQSKKSHPHIQENIDFLIGRLQTSNISHQDTLQVETKDDKETSIEKESFHSDTIPPVSPLGLQAVEDIEEYIDALMHTSHDTQHTISHTQDEAQGHVRDW